MAVGTPARAGCLWQVTSTLVVVTVVSVSDVGVAASSAEIRLPNWTHTPVAIAQVAVAVGGIGGI